MNSSQEAIPHTCLVIPAKINRTKLKTDLVRFFMENKVGSLIYFFFLKSVAFIY